MKPLVLCLFLFASHTLSALPAQVILLRHAEKPEAGNVLSTKGKERAAALAPYLSETEAFLKFGTPVAIYAMAAPNGDSSLRPIDTVTPLAEKLKLKVNDRYQHDDYKRMVEEIMGNPTYHGKTVIVCWEHIVLPQIARAFGALQTPARWTSDIYDRLWVITFTSGGKTTFQNLPQRLLYGDSAK